MSFRELTRIVLITGLLSSIWTTCFSQLSVIQGASLGMTPEQFVQTYLIGQGVQVSNVTFNGSTGLISSDQIGYFLAENQASQELGLKSGILMTSGEAAIAIGPNNQGGAGFSTGGVGDPDLTQIAGTTTFDAAVLEFDFVPMSDTVRFRYVFGSEEFYVYCNSINDAFGFFLSGPGISGPFSNNAVNLALMPVSGNPVTINNICADNTSNWCNDPGQSPTYQNCSEATGLYLEYNAFTYVFTATYVVTPCVTYHIKLAVADAADHILDSGVFLEQNSFYSPGFTVSTTYSIPSLDGKAVEACNDAFISLLLSQPVSQDYTVYYTIGGTAVNGIDYTEIADSIVIPSGQDSASIVIHPLEDGLPEIPETIILGVQVPSCFGAQVYYDTITIFDKIPLSILPSQDEEVCEGETVILEARVTSGQRPLTYTWQPGAGNDSVLQVTPPPGIHQYIVTITDACGQQEYDTIQVTVSAEPQFTNPPPLSKGLCSGESTNITFSALPSTTVFSWTVTPNTVGATPGFNQPMGLINQVLSNPGPGVQNVTYTITPDNLGCIGISATCVVTVNPRPIPGITGPGAVCLGQNATYSTETGMSDYSWTVSPDGTIVSGAGTSTIQVSWPSTGVKLVTVNYTNAFGCAAVSPSTYQVNVNILPVPGLTGANQVCIGNTESYTTEAGMSDYSWNVSSGGSIIAGGGANDASVTITWNVVGNQSVSVNYSLGTGCTGAAPTALPITINPRPSPIISGVGQLCEFSSATYGVPPAPGNTYAWVVSGGAITSGQGSPSITVNWGGFGSGSVDVIETITATGCDAPAPSFPVILDPYPLQPDPVSGVNEICRAQNDVVFSIPPITYASSSVWSYTGTGVTLDQPDPYTVSLDFGLTATSGDLQVKGINNCGEGPTISHHIDVHPLPVITFTPCPDTCSQDTKPFPVRGGYPLGGAYQGQGVLPGGIFDPSMLLPGNYQIRYSITNVFSCLDSASALLTVVVASAPFSCGNLLTDIRDGKQYRTVQIGTQCWMAQNLNAGSRIADNQVQKDNCVLEKFCYANQTSNCTLYGGLYQWNEAMQFSEAEGNQGICPPGWHIPSEDEWNTLFTGLGSVSQAGNPLKTSGFSGFNAEMTGAAFQNIYPGFLYEATLLWTSTESGNDHALAHGLHVQTPSVSFKPTLKSNALAIRCVRD